MEFSVLKTLKLLTQKCRSNKVLNGQKWKLKDVSKDDKMFSEDIIVLKLKKST